MELLKSKALRWAAGLALVGGCAWFALPYIVDVNQYRGLIQDQLRAKLGREVKLGPMELSVTPLAIRIRDFSIGEDPAVTSKRPFASAKELRVRLGLMALLRKQVEVSSIALDSPSVEIIRKADGSWNFSSLGSSGGSASEPPKIDALTIQDGAVGFTDLRDSKPERTQYDHLDVKLTDYGRGSRFHLDAAARMPGGKSSIEWSGSGTGPKDIEGRLRLVDVTVDALRNFAHEENPADLDATLSGEMDVRAIADSLSAKGKLDIAGVRVKRSKLTFPLAMVFDVRQEGVQTQVSRLDVAVGASKFNITGELEEKSARLQIQTKDSPIDELLQLAASFGAGADPSMQGKGKLSATVNATGPFDKLEFNGNVDAVGLEVRNSKWKQPVRIADLRLALTPSEIRSTPFQVDAGGTKLAGNFKVSNYAAAEAAVEADLRADNASVAELLSVAQAFGAAAPDVSGTGTVDLDIRVQGSAKRPRLSGKGRIDNAQLNLPGVNKPLTVARVDARFEENGVAIDRMDANLAGSKVQGNLSIHNFAEPVVKFALNIDRWNTVEMQQLFASSGSPSDKKPSAFAKASGNGTIDVGSLVINDLVLNQVHSTCVLDHGVLTLEPLTAELFGGGISGRLVADLRPASPEITVKAKMDQVDANKLISAATPLKQVLFGKFNADTDLKLVAGPDMAKSLNGAVLLRLADGKFAGINLMNEISKFAKFFGWNTAQPAITDFVKMGGTLRIVNGVAQTNDLDVQMNGAKFSAAGTINLVAQTLDMRLGTVLDSEFSKKVGGNQIGGMMVSAMADERGQLIIPSLLRGPFSKPVVSPDTEQFAKLKLKSMAKPEGFKETKEKVEATLSDPVYFR
jgi:uncharacterized protein involved in outer membrane biogenesis